ncbi:MAG TPA: hypothetical protein PLU50_12610, partial [Pseudobdellovibrionaceae bacterium]|nr:hypothetical protein [Pseudobdellovibrionaceae bacterium]
DDYDDWLHTLIAHEFTHTVHLDMAKGFVNKALRLLFGRFWLPNAPQQQWAHEGLAMLYETLDTTRGRGRSSLMQMFLRTVSLEDRFVGIDRATYWNDQYPYGNTAYWYGIGFYQYLMSKYGEAKVIEFVHATASSPVPGFMNFKTDSVFGKSLHRLWQEWKFEEKEKWTIFKNENESHFKSKVPDSKQAWILNGQPTWDAEKRILYAPVRHDRENSIQAFQFDSNANLTSKKVKAGTAAKLHFYDGKLIYSESKSESEFRNYSDVIVYDIKLEKEFRITKGLRVRDPIVYRDRLIGIRTDAFESSIVSLPWKKVIEAIQSEQPIANKSELEVLYKA